MKTVTARAEAVAQIRRSLANQRRARSPAKTGNYAATGARWWRAGLWARNVWRTLAVRNNPRQDYVAYFFHLYYYFIRALITLILSSTPS